MGMLEVFGEAYRDKLAKAWSVEGKLALLRVLLELYRSDGVYSEEEQRAFEKTCETLGVEVDAVERVDFCEAMATLGRDEKKMELVYMWIAEAIFADGVYDDREKAFVEDLLAKYHLSEEKLRKQIRRAQGKQFKDVMQGWLARTEEPGKS